MENIFIASRSFHGIRIDAIASTKGIRNILINNIKSQFDSSKFKKVTTKDSAMFNLFQQLEEYFNRKRTEFDLPLEINGTDFQKKVWSELEKIIYGKTITYQELATRLGDVRSIRAAGRANGANTLPIVIPCHRVIGTNGKLIGYGGGLDVKRKLLELEGSLNPDLFT